MSNVSKTVLVLAVLCAARTALAQAPTAPPAAPRIKVAIVPGIAVNLDAARVDALSQDLADALSTELDVDAAGGLDVRRALPPLGLPADCVAQQACIDDVAKRLGANQLLFVVMVDTGSGGAIQIDSTWVEPSTQKSASRPAIDIASLSESKARFIASAPSLLPDAPRRPKPKSGGGPNAEMSAAIPRHVTRPVMIFGGVAVVGLGVGIGFGLSTRSKYNACDDDIVACKDDKRDSIRTRAAIADVGYAIALGGAITAAILYATSGRESQLIISPTDGGGATAMWFGSF